MEDLAKRGVDYREIVVPGNPEAEAELRKLTKGENTVPVIVEDDRIQIGFGGG
jgi:glutaredoxin